MSRVPRSIVQPIGTFDAYLVHASEDASQAERLVAALRALGFTVWFNTFLVGPSIRDQMERGLADSDFGIVLLSPRFFGKQWARNELDALFGLEKPGETRILPVWLDVTAEAVRDRSPMLAARAAAVWKNDDDTVVADLVRSIRTLGAAKSPGRRLRMQIATGLPWMQGPVFMPKSLAAYDRSFSEQFLPTELVAYPGIQQRALAQPTNLINLMTAHALWDGRRFTCVAHLVEGSMQVLDELMELPPDPNRPSGACVAAYVFRLESVDFKHNELCYVHCIGPYDRGKPGMGTEGTSAKLAVHGNGPPNGVRHHAKCRWARSPRRVSVCCVHLVHSPCRYRVRCGAGVIEPVGSA